MMRAIREEMEKAKKQMKELDAEFTKELKKEFELSKEGVRRRKEDGKGWEELLKSMPVDLSKLLEHDKADEKRAEEILKKLEPRLKTIPKETLLQAQEYLRWERLFNGDLVTAVDGPTRFSISQAFDGDGTVERSHSTDSGGMTEGSCGDIVVGSGYPPIYGMYPRAYSKGSGRGLEDFNTVLAECWLWFYIPSAYVPKPGTLYVWPYFDLHGYYWVRANDGWTTSKEARITLKMHMRLFRDDFQYAPWFTWVVLDRGNSNIDEDGRVDYTGWHTQSKGILHMLGGETVKVQVIAELRTHAEGSGSHALLDFQTGENNWIRIPMVSGILV